ncbi:MAG: crossover junction endodeoxyribonuclease RuvC [Actinomycetota bacterium]|nr:crossover junction endodeoxyribonuclease RuvC [Actinomycetota bacterium]
MRVLGVDPGVATMGVAVVERGASGYEVPMLGAIRTSAGSPQAQRLGCLRAELLDVIATHRPEVMVVERLFFNSNVRTAMSVGQASGVALACAAEAALEVFDYTPPEVKQSVVGIGNATKHQVQVMVASLLKLDRVPDPPDAADACALAICHINRSRLAAAVKAASR